MATRTRIDPEAVRELWAAGLNDSQIARRLGASKSGAQQVRAGLGLARRHLPARERVDVARVVELHAAGGTDRAIAAACGVAKRTVCGLRAALGLPANHAPGSGQGFAHAARRAAAARLAARYGLPADLRPRQVAMVLALTAGPLTRAEWFAAARMAAAATGRQTRFNYVTDLERRGLVVRVTGSDPATGHRTPDSYLLTGAAMELLSGATGGHADAGD